MKRLLGILILVSILSVSLLNGCYSYVLEGNMEESSAEFSQEEEESIDVIPPEPEKITVNIDFASELTLSRYASFEEFIENEQCDRILIWMDKGVKTFSFIELGFSYEGDTFSFYPVAEIFTMDTLHTDKPIVIETALSDGIPTRGISFTDGNNARRYFFIRWSEEKGTIAIIEFEYTEVIDNEIEE